jgi:hypothetical protein
VSELRDRLERLAGRGAPRGADDVLNAAMRGVPTNEVEVVPEDNGNDLTIIDDDAPFVTSEEVEPHRRSRYGTLVATFGVAALVGVAGLAIASVFGNGGAASPEGAVRQLADAISHKDPLAAVDVLSPTEVRSMRQTVDGATHRAADLKIVDNASAPFTGVDLSVDHLQLSTQPLADGYTKVTVTGGEVTASTHTAAMSKLVQDALRNSGSANSKGNIELAKIASDADLPTFVVTVRHDGRWYVSPAYTALEYAREADGGPAAEFGSAKNAANLGADTPEHAVSDALHAWQAGNWDRMMALAPPDELPVYDYRNWLNQLGTENEPNFTIDKLTTSSTTSGDAGTVKLEASGTMGSGEDQMKWQVGGTCPDPFGSYGSALSSSGSAQELFTGNGDTSVDNTMSPVGICLAGDLGNVVPFGLYPIGGADGGSPTTGAVSIDVVRENGRWFVSPVTTVLRTLDSTIQHLDERTIYTLLGLAYELPPDGNITLGQPFTLPTRSAFGASVFSFDGTKGQKLIGEIDSDNSYASGEIYTPDGKQVDYVEFSTVKNGYAFPVSVPATGSYRLIVNSGGGNAKLTLWDAKDAPKGLTSNSSSDNCQTNGISSSCSSSGGVSYPSTGGGDMPSCTIATNTVTCAGQPPITICAAGEAGAKPDCIPSDIAKTLVPGGAAVTATTSGASVGHAVEAAPTPESVPHTTVGPTPTVLVTPNTVGVPTSMP